jgi:8-oxo-dGTP pyrophosphatase MutT (NUDIX family)
MAAFLSAPAAGFAFSAAASTGTLETMQPSTGNTTHILHGTRIGAQGKIRLGVSVVLRDGSGANVLLTRRSDNGLWCLPGGMVDPGESVSETCEREMLEETGLTVRVSRLVGVYSDPDMLIVYPDGNRLQVVVLCFAAERLGGELGLSDETTGIRFFPVEDAVRMDLFHGHAGHLRDALTGQAAPFIR